MLIKLKKIIKNKGKEGVLTFHTFLQTSYYILKLKYKAIFQTVFFLPTYPQS